MYTLDSFLVPIRVIHYMKRKTIYWKRRVALKIYINKAYNRVDWIFLKGM